MKINQFKNNKFHFNNKSKVVLIPLKRDLIKIQKYQQHQKIIDYN